MTKTMEKLTSTTAGESPLTWVPDDAYANVLIQSGVKFGQLVGKVTLMQYDMQECDGDIIQVKYVRPRLAQNQIGGSTAQGGISPCLSATSTTIGTQAVQLYKYGDYDRIPGWSEFEVCGNLRATVMEEMSRGMGRRLDSELWNALENCHPNVDVETDGAWSATPTIEGSCCTFSFGLYNAIIQAQMNLRGDGLNPNYVIMHPTVAAFLYYKDGHTMPDWSSTIKWDASGLVKTVNGMEVIECQVPAATGVATSGATIAIVIDSNHAVAEAWGKKPTFSREYVPECDYTKEVLWVYWGCHNISGASVTGICNGIGHITNP